MAISVCALLTALLQVFSKCWFPWLLRKETEVILRHAWEDWIKKKLTELSETTQKDSDEGRESLIFYPLLWLAKAAFITLKLWCRLKCSGSMHSVPAWRSKIPRLDQTRVVMHCVCGLDYFPVSHRVSCAVLVHFELGAQDELHHSAFCSEQPLSHRETLKKVWNGGENHPFERSTVQSWWDLYSQIYHRCS